MARGARLAGAELLERGQELARIEQTITALEGAGGVLIIQGAAGIGKSALLHVLCQDATAQGIQTLTARASELEREFGFGVVRQLLEARIVRADTSERAELLTGAAALAGPVLGLGGAVADSFAALHGLYWLLANLALSGPVVLAVDDLQWADEPSLRWLIYLCRRLEGLPVLVAATTRAPRPGHPQLLAELLAVGGVHLLRPGPLSETAAARLIGEGLGAAPDPAFVTACARVTGGNPFALREMIFDLAADGIKPVAAQATRVAERIPGQVQRTVLARMGRLDEAGVRLARAIAVLGDGTELRLAAALAHLDLDAAAAAADALLTADLLAKARPLQFVHPLVRSAVYDQLAPGDRAQTHAHAARLLIRQGADDEQIAAQLMLCEPAGDAEAVRALRAAAAAALARGVPDTAITYLRRAVTEPPGEATRAAVLGELGSAEKVTRDPAAAIHLEQARQASTDPLARARLVDQLANVLVYASDLARCSAVLQAGIDDLGDRDLDLAVRLKAHLAGYELCTIYPTAAHAITLDRLRRLAARSVPASRMAQLLLAGLLAVRGESCHEVAALVERGWDGGRFLTEESSEVTPTVMAVWALIFTDDLAQAQALAEATLADAQARGSVVGLESTNGRRGLIALRRGALADAEADLRAAYELATEYNLTLSGPFQAGYLGLTLLARGKLDQAAAIVEASTLGPVEVLAPIAGPFLEARGRVRLARGQRAQGIADLRRCGQLADLAGLRNPNYLTWRSSLALALAPEHPQQARELAQPELELARRVGSSRAIGIALRVCGLLTGGKEGIELLEGSVNVLEPTPMRLELAYSLTEWGAALRHGPGTAASSVGFGGSLRCHTFGRACP